MEILENLSDSKAYLLKKNDNIWFNLNHDWKNYFFMHKKNFSSQLEHKFIMFYF